jgi:hypothetical protein
LPNRRGFNRWRIVQRSRLHIHLLILDALSDLRRGGSFGGQALQLDDRRLRFRLPGDLGLGFAAPFFRHRRFWQRSRRGNWRPGYALCNLGLLHKRRD